MEKKNILIMSNSPNLSFGYSVVFGEVAKALSDAGHNVYYIGMQTSSPPSKYENYTLLGVGYDHWGRDVLEEYLRAYEIDIFISGFDLWMDCVSYVKETLLKFNNIFWIAHITINSSPMSPLLYRNMDTCGVVISPSKYVDKEVKRTKLSAKSVYLPHFVDLEIFNPDDEAGKKVRSLLSLDDKFVFLAVMRNRDMHKNPGALMKAFLKCISSDKEMYDNARMLFITDPVESVGVNLVNMRNLLGLKDHVIFPRVKNVDNKILISNDKEKGNMKYNTLIAISREGMNDVYNACDIHVNTSSGESFGLPTLESMACGKPQICNVETTGRELVESSNSGIAVPSVCKQMQQNYSEIALIDEDKLAESMKEMFHSKKLEDYKNNSLKKAEEYEISKVKQMWVDLIDKVSNKIDKFNDNLDFYGGSIGI